MSDDWLWDGQGEPDAQVAALEAKLRPLRFDQPPPKLPLPPRRPTPWWAIAVVAVGAPVVVAVFAYAPSFFHNEPGTYALEGMQGGSCGTSDCQWHEKGMLDNAGSTPIRVHLATLGTVDVAPGARLVLQDAKKRRLALLSGHIETDLAYAPRVLTVVTRGGTVVDLGCHYTLQVDESGEGGVRVLKGAVAVEDVAFPARIPEGAAVVLHPGGPALPVFQDASVAFVTAVAASDLDGMLAEARPRDTLTLWNLLPRVEGAERQQVFDRVVALAPSVLPTDEAGVLRLDSPALEMLWRDLLPIWYPKEAP